MTQFTNAMYYPSPRSELSNLEIQVLMEVIDQVLGRFQKERLAKGTLTLDGQRYGEDSNCILRANLAGGPFMIPCVRPGPCLTRTSDELAAEAIDAMLELDDNSPYARKYQELRGIDAKVMRPATGIYRTSGLTVMVLNATYGRFLVSFYLQPDIYHGPKKCELSTAILCAVTSVLWRLNERGDAVVARGAQTLLAEASEDELVQGLCREAAVEVYRAFFRVPAFTAWSQIERLGDRKPYFEGAK